jgi:outer membrane protein assembly factor BamB
MRGNPQNTGCWGFGPPQPGARLYWGFAQRGGEAPGILNATPIVDAEGTVYVGSSDRGIYRLHPGGSMDRGDVKAVVDSAGCFTQSGRLYFPAGDFSLHGALPGAPAFPGFGLQAHPDSPSTIHWLEGNVVTNGAGRLYAGCDNFFFYCCQDTSSGASTSMHNRWSFATGFFIWSAAAFTQDNKVGCVASADMTVYGFDPLAEPGQPRVLWTSQLGNLCASSPAVTSDGRVVVGAFDGKVYGMYANSGQPCCEPFDTGALIYASPALFERDGVRRMFVLSSDGVLRAFDIASSIATPRLLWSCFTGMPGFSSPVVGPDPQSPGGYLVYVATGDGIAMAIDPQGRPRGSFDVAALRRTPQDQGDDPAFWPSLSYPAINASLALSPQGVVAVTSGGVVASIPYGSFVAGQGGVSDGGAGAGDVPRPAWAFRYVAPSGRMAAGPLGAGPVPVDRGQLLSFASVSAQGFMPLPATGVTVCMGDKPLQFSLSADRTLLHVPAPEQDDPFVLSIRVDGLPFGTVFCQPRPIRQPLSLAALQQGVWQVTRMSVFSPFVVPALDQLAIATIPIALRILHVRAIGAAADQAEVVAYGCEHYGDVAPGRRPRNLMYLFRGHYRQGVLTLEARDCYFELSAMPISLDTLRLSAVLGEGEGGVRGLSLSASYQENTAGTVRWLYDAITKWLPPLGGKGKDKAPAAEVLPPHADTSLSVGSRLAIFLVRLAGLTAERLIAPWKLFDGHSAFFWAGTFSLDRMPPSPEPAPGLDLPHCSFAALALHLQVTLPKAMAETDLPASGILLFDAQTQEPLDLPYTTLNQWPEVDGTAVRYTLLLTEMLVQQLGPGRSLTARVMFGPQQAQGEFGFQLPG